MILDYLMQGIFRDREGYISRKLSASYLLSICMTILLVSNHLDASNYTILMTTIWAAFFGVDTFGSVSYAKNHPQVSAVSIDTPENINDIGN